MSPPYMLGALSVLNGDIDTPISRDKKMVIIIGRVNKRMNSGIKLLLLL